MRKFFKVALESEAGALELTAEQAAVAAQAVAAAQPQTVSVTIELNPQQQAEVTAQAADAAQAAAAVAEAPVAEAPAAELPAKVATGEGPAADAVNAEGEAAAAVEAPVAEGEAAPAADAPAAEEAAPAAEAEPAAAEAGEAAAPVEAEAAATEAPVEEVPPATDEQAEHAQATDEELEAIDAEAENLSMEEEQLMLDEAQMASAESGADLAEADRCLEVSDALEDLAVIADEITEATPAEVALVENAGSLAVAGTDVAPEEIVPALEAFGGKIDTTKIKQTAAAIWKSIQKFLAEVWEKIEAFFYNTIGTIPAMRKRLKELAAEAKSVGHKTPKKKTQRFKTGAASFTIGSKTVKNEAELAQGLISLKESASYVYGSYTDTLVRRGEAIAKAIGDFDAKKPKETAVALKQQLRTLSYYAVPGASGNNRGRFPGFDSQQGSDLLGGVSLVSKNYIENKADVSILGSLDRYRHTAIELSNSNDDEIAREFEIVTFTPGGIQDLVKDCGLILDQIELYQRGGRSKAVAAKRKNLEAASNKAAAELEKLSASDAGTSAEAVATFRAILNFNAAFATWARNPAVPFTTNALSVVRATMLAIRTSLVSYGQPKEEKKDDKKDEKKDDKS